MLDRFIIIVYYEIRGKYHLFQTRITRTILYKLSKFHDVLIETAFQTSHSYLFLQ